MRPAFLRRLAALLLDYLLILAWVVVLLGATLAVDFAVFGGIPDLYGIVGIAGSEALTFCALTLPVGIYLFLCERSPAHATWGKRMLRLTVTRADGLPPSPTRILVRTVVKLLPWEFAHFFVFQVVYYSVYLALPATPAWVLAGLIAANVIPLVYLAIVAFSPQRRGPHDYAAGTAVHARTPGATMVDTGRSD